MKAKALSDPLMDVSRETLDRLGRLQDLTLKWTQKINLVAPSSTEAFWDRHIKDCAQLWQVKPDAARIWIDLGSGGGFPGLVMACLAAQYNPDLQLTLVESDQRKCVFLRQAARDLDVRITVLTSRIEEANLPSADVVSARALAAVKDILALSTSFTKPSTRFILPKGKTVDEELEAARETWSFNVVTYESVTDSDGRILSVSNVEPRI